MNSTDNKLIHTIQFRLGPYSSHWSESKSIPKSNRQENDGEDNKQTQF